MVSSHRLGLASSPQQDSCLYSAKSVLGCTEGELLDAPMHDVVHGARAAYGRRPGKDCPLWDVMHSGHSMAVDHDTLTRKDGALCPVA
jgi:hypothetical protein